MSALADPDAFGVFTAAWDAVINDIHCVEMERQRLLGVKGLLFVVGIAGLKAGRYLWSKRRSTHRGVRRRR